MAEAARALRVSERTLRRALSAALFAGRTLAEDRQTPKGCRRTTLLPPDLLSDLREHLRARETLTGSGGDSAAQAPETAAGSPAGSEANAGTPPNEPRDGELPAVAYQAIIGRQEREIAYLKQLLGEANAREQDANERQRLTLEALGREQTLRALAAPAPDVSAQAQDSPPDAPQGPQENDSGEVAAEAGPGENVVAGDNVSEQSRRRSWWPWGRK